MGPTYWIHCPLSDRTDISIGLPRFALLFATSIAWTDARIRGHLIMDVETFTPRGTVPRAFTSPTCRCTLDLLQQG